MKEHSVSKAAKAVVRRNTEEVQSRGNFAVFEELFAEDFVDHTPQPNSGADREGVRGLYQTLRAAFPDFHAEIHWQTAEGDLVTTYKTYHGTHRGPFLGAAPTGRKIHFESVDVMRVKNGKITDHWGVGNLYSLMQQIGSPASSEERAGAPPFVDRLLDDWAMAWTSNEPEKVVALFTDDCVFEDVTFGLVARGKEEIRSFAKRAFAAVPDFEYGVISRFATNRWGVIEWEM